MNEIVQIGYWVYEMPDEDTELRASNRIEPNDVDMSLVESLNSIQQQHINNNQQM